MNPSLPRLTVYLPMHGASHTLYRTLNFIIVLSAVKRGKECSRFSTTQEDYAYSERFRPVIPTEANLFLAASGMSGLNAS
ncbi:hypothetical protein D4S03_11260 [bacterium]|nr:MAG: hypothetical protein D4S03_11260 [bacterium]